MSLRVRAKVVDDVSGPMMVLLTFIDHDENKEEYIFSPSDFTTLLNTLSDIGEKDKELLLTF